MKKGICFTIYGTKEPEALGRWETLKAKLREKYQEYAVYFLILTQEQENPLIASIKEDGIESLLFVPLMLEEGHTYQKHLAIKEKFQEELRTLSGALPLLSSSSAIRTIGDYFASRSQQTLLVLHGRHGKEDLKAIALNEVLPPGIRAISLEGSPTLEEVIGNWKEKDVEVYPLMILGGAHTRDDIRSEEEDSIFSRLRREGYAPRLSMETFAESQLLETLVSLSLEEEL